MTRAEPAVPPAAPGVDGHVGVRVARPSLWRRLVAEFLGTGLLVAVVVGSGIAAQRLSPGDVGLQLLQNSTATALGLAVLIALFGPVSGAHLNPVVTLADWVLSRRRRAGLPVPEVAAYVVVQCAGGIGGALVANVMFDVEVAVASTERAGAGPVVGEVVATAGLVLVIFALLRSGRAALVAPAVGAWIGAAYWFTSSTSFANPAVTVGRIFSDTFAGIAPASVPAFVVAQVVGAVIGVALVLVLYPADADHAPADGQGRPGRRPGPASGTVPGSVSGSLSSGSLSSGSIPV